MDLAKIKSLIDLVSRSRVTDLELVEGDTILRISRRAREASPAPDAGSPAASPAAIPRPLPDEAAPEPAGDGLVRSPSFGVFHRTPAPEAPPFVDVGTAVEAGQTLCLLEAMKVFTPVVAAKAGVVDAVLAEAGEEVEAGQPLFRIRQ